MSVAGESRRPAPDGAVDALAPPAAADSDLALLRAHEPVVRYTRGELFLPTAVDPYVAQSSLWARARAGDQTKLVQRGELTLERLAGSFCLLGAGFAVFAGY